MKTNNNSKIVADANFKRCMFKPNKSDLKDIKARQSKLDLDNITIVNQTKTGYTAIIKDMWLQLKKILQSIPYNSKGFSLRYKPLKFHSIDCMIKSLQSIPYNSKGFSLRSQTLAYLEKKETINKA